MPITFQRSALYDEVWTEPLTKLGKKYGLSDNGLRKVCKAMNIPLPQAGHWARLAAGQVVPRTPLPDEVECVTFVSNPPPAPEDQFHVPEDDAWMSEHMSLEESSDFAIVVPAQVKHWHSAVAPLRDRMKERLAEVERWRRSEERAARQESWARSPGFEGWKWRSFLRDGQLLLEAPLRVTPKTYARALCVANSVCIEAQRRGFKASLSSDSSRIQLDGHGATVFVRLTEKLDQEVRREPRYPGGSAEDIKVKNPTGQLKLIAGTSTHSEREIATDNTARQLEGDLNSAFVRIYAQIVRYRQAERKRDAWRRDWELAQAQRVAEAQRAAMIRKRKLRLIRETRNWHRSQAIRSYVGHVVAAYEEANPSSADFTPVHKWRSWALELANGIDPTVARLTRLQSTDDDEE